MITHIYKRALGTLVVALTLLTIWPGMAKIALAQEIEISPLHIVPSGSSLQVQWTQPDAEMNAAADEFLLPLAHFGGYQLPMTGITVRLSGTEAASAGSTALASSSATAAIHSVESVPYTKVLHPTPLALPPALDWEPIPSLLPEQKLELPSAPIFLLQQGTIRGMRVAMYGFSPIYQDPVTREIRYTTHLDATLPGTLLNTEDLLDFMASGVQEEVGATGAAGMPPTNFLANQSGTIKIAVSKAGIQHITGAELAAAGMSTPKTAKLRLFLQGNEIPLQVIDNEGNGQLDAADAVRFYASPPGDRWNLEDIYWLVAHTQDGLRMPTRDVRPPSGSSVPIRATAWETGVWAKNMLYESTMPGLDADHWFHLDARVDPAMQGETNSYPTFSADLKPQLPLVSNSTESGQLTLTMTVYDWRKRAANNQVQEPQQLPHRLQVRAGNHLHTDGMDEWVIDFSEGALQDSTRSFQLPTPAQQVQVTLLAGPYHNALKFDRIFWRLPVQLNFAGKGASFMGAAGNWRYQITNAADGRTLYDISNPNQPVVLQVPTTRDFAFQDGPAEAHYLLTGAGALHQPRLIPHQKVDLGAQRGAQAIYIAPAAFHQTLQPLVTHRTAQGYAVQVIDVQSIYDSWSYGAVAPEAIRSFLRHAVATWKPSPISVVLVGDGTSDPLDYLGYGNPNIIPPYLAHVDPWLRETACDACYAELDDISDWSNTALFADIWLGRFPVIDTTELATVINKIISYETGPNLLAPWRRISLQVADDYIKPDGTIDQAGNFPELVEQLIEFSHSTKTELQKPAELAIEFTRHYFQSDVDFSQLPVQKQEFFQRIAPWIESNPEKALQRSIAYLRDGAALVTYTGHSNHWQWAVTDSTVQDGRLFGLWDVLQLNNKDRLFIALSMTCYTSQFSKPAPSHFTLDEHLLLHGGGGAAAVWGPAGLSVAHGHDLLQRGFYHALLQSLPGQAKLGALVQAGNLWLMSNDACCNDIPKTFLILGDPLTPLLLRPSLSIYLPVTQSNRASSVPLNLSQTIYLPMLTAR
jgi:hypothetical protein